MKHVIPLCLLSSFVGAAAALWWVSPVETTPASAAQEPSTGLPQYGRTVPVPSRSAAPDRAVRTVPPASPRADDLMPEELVNVAVYENANKAVVNIDTTSLGSQGFFLFEIPSQGAGSGVVVDREGHVLTNFHVIEDAREVQVTLFNGRKYDARLVGVDPINDVAVLKIDAPADELFPVTFGDSSRLRVGQRVFAIGNPFGLERTMTTGIISSLDRKIPSRQSERTIKQIIQVDAPINPGNSGGPLIDSRSRMIGMNTAIYSKKGESAGVGFAIPINTIARVVPQLIDNGRVVRPDAGIDRMSALEDGSGLVIVSLARGGPAEQAGLRPARVVRHRERRGPFLYEYRTVEADVITAVDGQPVASEDDFYTIIESKQPGDRVVVTFIRDEEQLEAAVVLEAE